MQNIVRLNTNDKNEIAEYIKAANLEAVNRNTPQVVPARSFYTRFGKRVLDFFLSLIAVIITLPINLILAVITFFDVGFPIIFKQERIGKGKKEFVIYKFRNMTNKTDANGELLPPEKRVTKWGKIARKTSLDELMNFISVLKGDMSFVGPRPLLLTYADQFNDYHAHRFDVRPGLECPTLKKLDHVMTWDERLDNDVWYVENCSFKTDVKLFFRIFQTAFDKKATKTRGQANAGRFLGYDRDGTVITSHKVPDEIADAFCRAHGFSSIEEVVESYQKQEKSTEERT